MKTSFVKGPRLPKVSRSLFSKVSGRIKRIRHEDSVEQIINAIAEGNPDRVVFFGHGYKSGEIHISSSDKSGLYHPACLEADIGKAKSVAGYRSKLKVVEVYGCSIGAGINDGNFQALHALKSSVDGIDASSPQSSNALKYSNISPNITYILNSGKNWTSETEGRVSQSLKIDNIFELILNKILTYPETFKVLKRKSIEDSVHVFLCSGPKPKTPTDLSDENIKIFLLEKVHNFVSFYLGNYSGALSEDEEKILEQYCRKINKLSAKDISDIRYEYFKIEIKRGKIDYLDKYLHYIPSISRRNLMDLIGVSVAHNRVNSLHLLYDRFPLREYNRYMIDYSVTHGAPDCLQFFLQRNEYVPSLDKFLKSTNQNTLKESRKTVALLLIYNCEMPKDIVKSGPIATLALYIRALPFDSRDGLINRLPKLKNDILEKLLRVIDEDLQDKVFGDWDGSKDSVEIAYQKLIDYKFNEVPLSELSARGKFKDFSGIDSTEESSSLEEESEPSREESESFGEEHFALDALDDDFKEKFSEVDIKDISDIESRPAFLYQPKDIELQDSLWLRTQRRGDFRIVDQNESFDYDLVKNIMVNIVLQAAKDADISDQEAIKAIIYARNNGGISNIYNSETQRYEPNKDLIPLEWRRFSKIFQDYTKENDILSSKAEKGLRLTFITSSVLNDLGRICSVDIESAASEVKRSSDSSPSFVSDYLKAKKLAEGQSRGRG
jgi:hypothetical protein